MIFTKVGSTAASVPWHGMTSYMHSWNFPRKVLLSRKKEPVIRHGEAGTTGRFTCPRKTIYAIPANGIRDFGTSAYWVPLLLTEEAAERRMDKKKVPVCPECGGTDIDILSDEGVAVCNDCCLEWPYAED